MILAPAVPVAPSTRDTLVTIRLIGMLDRVLMQSSADALAGLTVAGQRTIIVRVCDLIAVRDENLERFLNLLDTFRAAGNRVFIDSTPAWRRMVRGLRPQFEESDVADDLGVRRQIIICHSVDKRAGAA